MEVFTGISRLIRIHQRSENKSILMASIPLARITMNRDKIKFEQSIPWLIYQIELDYWVSEKGL